MTNEEIEAMLPSPPCSDTLGWRLLDADVERGWIKVGFVEDD